MIISILSSLKVQHNELKILKEQFQKIDSNHDGILTYEELTSNLRNLQQLEILKINEFDDDFEKNIKQLVSHIDVDGDGRIDYMEFVQAAIDHKALLNKDNITSIFRMLDSNGDGYISKSELMENFNG